MLICLDDEEAIYLARVLDKFKSLIFQTDFSSSLRFSSSCWDIFGSQPKNFIIRMTFIAENAALVAVNDKGCTHALSVILWTRLSLCASLNRHKVAASGKTYFVHFLHLCSPHQPSYISRKRSQHSHYSNSGIHATRRVREFMATRRCSEAHLQPSRLCRISTLNISCEGIKNTNAT